MRQPRNAPQKKLDDAMRANGALYLLDTLAEMLEQIPHVDARLARKKEVWRAQLITERNRMLPLSDAADELLHNAKSTGAGGLIACVRVDGWVGPHTEDEWKSGSSDGRNPTPRPGYGG